MDGNRVRDKVRVEVRVEVRVKVKFKVRVRDIYNFQEFYINQSEGGHASVI